MSMIEKMLAAFKPKQAAPEAPVVPDANVQAEAPAAKAAPDPQAVADMATKLEAYVYDPEVAAELAPVMVEMSAVEGFDKVLELLDAKEKQIEAISGNTPQQSTPEVKTPVVTKPQTATDILKARNQSK